ncbi:MAG: hypothetical protein Q7U52_02385 [Hydrogenophaga sp.]|uniref:hypothetical protein n=1 Tax=Hydrogenophaga sp. TaxID=1904254 RepID=UPI002728907E|nr:hypothetical protein [Hydrogenophaga sp.]MDO9146516.1 hypothetical protein [Hydrogenophaga sp.]MDO9603611.1 hypothetical protein [Hydrogenophaga sp.]
MNTPIQTLSDDAAAVARSLVHSTERAAQQGMDRLSDGLDDARSHTSAALKQLAQGTETLAHRGMDAVRDGACQLREKSLHAKDVTTTYIQHEPVKSVLIAAAVGAALMGLVALLSRHGGSGR